MNSFDKEYYENNNYASYLERKERYKRLCEELHFDLFRKLNLDFSDQTVVDWGCAVGFVVNGFKSVGFKSVYGYDVSEWAVNWGKSNLDLNDELTTDQATIMTHKHCGLMTAFDVFEHMDIDRVKAVVQELEPDYLLVRIPVSEIDGGKYVLSVSEKDVTHITRMTKKSWIKLLDNCGYNWMFDVNLGLIYDSPGVMCSMFRTY